MDILAGHAELAHEIDLQQTQQRLEWAWRRVSEETDEEARSAAQDDVAKAETRLNLQDRA